MFIVIKRDLFDEDRLFYSILLCQNFEVAISSVCHETQLLEHFLIFFILHQNKSSLRYFVHYLQQLSTTIR